jgi:sigma-B regulation protein RsbU (phosphoserine phosphatase)
MRIRWKILLVLLGISLIPMLLMRSLGQRSMLEMGNDLATRTRDVLIRETSLELKNLVEEHATILRRERDLVEMALQLQASELEKIFTNHTLQRGGKKLLSLENNESDPIDTEPIRRKHIRRMGMMGSRPLDVSYAKQTYRIPSSLSKAEADQIIDQLAGMVPVYRSLERKHPDLIFWQLTAFENGTYTIYPAMQRIPMMHRDLKADWYRLAREKKQIVWSKPDIDPFTMQVVFTVSTPFYQSNGDIIGVTAIVVPVDVLLQEDDHIRKLSKNITSLLVRPEPSSVADTPGIRIIAREQLQEETHHHWRASLEEEWLEIIEDQQIELIVTDLQKHQTGVREVSYLNQESIMAYGSIDEYQTALLVIVPKADVVAEAAAMESYVRDRIGRQIKLTSIMLSIVILLVIGLALFLSKSVTRNISKLLHAVRRVAAGDFETRVQIASRDEMGELGRTFNRMVPELEERVSIKQALDLAMEVQQNLLPEKVPEIKGFDVAGRSIYCEETGGDLYDFLEVCCRGVEQIGIAVGDVSGHGIPAALLMASARAFLRSRVTQPGGIAEIVTDVNRLVSYDTKETGQFMTLFYTEIDQSEKTLKWVRAGHDPALLYDPGSDSFEELAGEGMALGVDREYAYREGGVIDLSEGQILLIGTDGLWETQNESGEMFGKDRIEALIRQHTQSAADMILSSIILAVQEYRVSARQEDDITIVVIKVVH